MNNDKILTGPSFSPHIKPKKLIFMLHGYGDTAENFINLANAMNDSEYGANFIALNAPTIIPNYPHGHQWFDLYPNGIYIADAGPTEINKIYLDILLTLKLIENTINKIKNLYKLSYKDCFLLGFSQGGMMTFEFGNYFENYLAGIAILSGRVMPKDDHINPYLLQTPIFISHGKLDKVIPLKTYKESCEYLKKNKFNFDSFVLNEDDHTISINTINLLKKFLKKTMN